MHKISQKYTTNWGCAPICYNTFCGALKNCTDIKE